VTTSNRVFDTESQGIVEYDLVEYSCHGTKKRQLMRHRRVQAKAGGGVVAPEELMTTLLRANEYLMHAPWCRCLSVDYDGPSERSSNLTGVDTGPSARRGRDPGRPRPRHQEG